MNKVAIRRCVSGDEAALSLVAQAAFLEAFSGMLAGEDIIAHCREQHSEKAYQEWLADAETAVWLAEVEPGRAPVGYLVLTMPHLPLADLGPGDIEVKKVYVLHRFQGGGTGVRLMNTAKEEALARGKKRMLLGVYEGNASAIGFYQRLGYGKVGTRTFQVGAHRYHDWVMGLELQRPG